MKYQRNIYFKYNTCTIEEHVHEISTIIMLIYVKFMKCWAKFKTIVNDEDIRVIQGSVLWRIWIESWKKEKNCNTYSHYPLKFYI